MAIGATLSGGVLTQRFGRRVLHAGFAVLIAGVAATYAVIDAQEMTVTSWQLAGPLLLAGFGVGLVIAPLFGFILAAVDDEEVGSASGVLNALQQLASAIGVAVLGTVFFAALPSPGYVDGLEQVLILVIGLAVAAMLLGLLLPRSRGRKRWGRRSASIVSGGGHLPSDVDTDSGVRSGRRNLLRTVAEGTAGAVGDEFLRCLVRHVALAFDAKFAFVAEATDPSGEHVRVLSGWYEDDWMDEPFEYDTRRQAVRAGRRAVGRRLPGGADEAIPRGQAGDRDGPRELSRGLPARGRRHAPRPRRP